MKTPEQYEKLLTEGKIDANFFKITELNDTAIKLRQKDDIYGFIYYENGAMEGNKFAMNMLSKYYREGKGCKIDKGKAKYWEQKAKQ